MQLTKSRLHKIINCKVQTRKQGFKNTNISKKTNTNTNYANQFSNSQDVNAKRTKIIQYIF